MSAPSVARLSAVTRWIEPAGDLLAHLGPDGFAWLRHGAGFVTAGTIASVEVDDAPAVLAAIEHRTEDGGVELTGLGAAGSLTGGPLAVGALAFDPEAPGRLTIPATIVGQTIEGRMWVTEIGGPGDVRVPGSIPTNGPSITNGEQPGDRESWRRAVLAALDAIERGPLHKVVLSRAVVVDADEPFDRVAVLTRLRNQQPDCFVYGAAGLVGASPELLVRRTGTLVESQPMAGTAIGDDAALTSSSKDASEHQYVVDAIVGALTPLCDELDWPGTPQLAHFGVVTHLVTPVSGRLREHPPAASTLARLLHPTPAVGGTPTAEALSTIARLEPDGRGRYAGPVGWVDAHGDGEWAIALRGAELNGRRALLRTGAGIVAGSDPDREWEETEAKLEPMLRALEGAND